MEFFNIEKFDALTKDMYAPAYPLIARQIVDRTGITEGNCLDIGTGCGYLGIALAKITALRVRLFDIAPQALCRAAQNAAEAGLPGRLETLQGDVQHIPLPENSIDLAVSRASMMFWPDMSDALREICRILVPGGCAYIGGGFGTDALNASIQEKREGLHIDWHDLTKLVVKKYTPETLAEEAQKVHRGQYRIFTEGGLWLLLRKEADPSGQSLRDQAQRSQSNSVQ